MEALNPGTASTPPRFSFVGIAGAINGTNPPNSLADTYTSTRTPSGWVTRYWGLQGNEVSLAGGAEMRSRHEHLHRLSPAGTVRPSPRTRRTCSRTPRTSGIPKATASVAGRRTSRSSKKARGISATTGLRRTSATTCSPRSTSPSPRTARPALRDPPTTTTSKTRRSPRSPCCQAAKTSPKAEAARKPKNSSNSPPSPPTGVTS